MAMASGRTQQCAPGPAMTARQIISQASDHQPTCRASYGISQLVEADDHDDKRTTKKPKVVFRPPTAAQVDAGEGSVAAGDVESKA